MSLVDKDYSDSSAEEFQLSCSKKDCEGVFASMEADEEANDAKIYAITINPDPKWYNSTSIDQQYDQLWNMLLRHCRKIFKDYIFTTELTEQGNVHVHGVFTLRDTKKYFKFWLPKAKRLGIPKYCVKIKTGVITVDWLEYMLKHHYKMIDMFDELPSTHTSLSEFTYVRKLTTYTRLARLSKRKKIPEKPKYTFFCYDDPSDSE